MSLAVFIDLVEARTKLASILPFTVGIAFTLAYFHQLNGLNTVLFFVAMLLFDMMTTALNNLMDYQKAKDQHYKANVNIIGTAKLKVKTVQALIITLLAVATGLGLILVWRTGWLLLVIGAACLVIGIFYTFGPLPLSRLPLGEVFSGVTMGLGIPLIAVYVNVDAAKLLDLQLAWPQLALTGDWRALLSLGLVCVAPMGTIANIMLANNLSDHDQDVANHRLTLPMYLSRAASGRLYWSLALVGFAAEVLLVGFGLLPWPVLIGLLALPLVWRQSAQFVAKPDKRLTFPNAIKTLVAENGALIVGLLVSWGVSR